MNNKNWKKRQNSYKFPAFPVRISEIPGNSRREFLGSRFPGIPRNSRTGIPGGLANYLQYRVLYRAEVNLNQSA